MPPDATIRNKACRGIAQSLEAATLLAGERREVDDFEEVFIQSTSVNRHQDPRSQSLSQFVDGQMGYNIFEHRSSRKFSDVQLNDEAFQVRMGLR